MKKAASVLISVLLIVCLFAGCGAQPEYEAHTKTADGNIAAVTFNCAAPWGSVLDGTSSSARVKRFAAYMNAVSPDIIGTQEMNGDWMEKLEELMPAYESYGVKRGGDDSEKKSEMNSVFWRSDRFEKKDCGTFWLSETPQEESRYDGAGCNRVCTWVLLEDRNGGEVLFMNTHLDNVSEEAQAFGAGVILDELSKLLNAHPQAQAILTGDFNQTRGMSAHSAVSAVPNDSLSAAENGEITGTYQEWGKQDNTEPIDFIFSSSGLEAAEYEVLSDISCGYVSDHYGVYAEFSKAQ